MKSRVITITSGKGGVGKTFTAVNLSIWLSQKGFNVLLFDADVTLSNSYIMLGSKQNEKFYNFLSGNSKIQDAVINSPYGVDIIANGNQIIDINDIPKEKIKTIYCQIKEMKKKYDFIIIDTPAGYSNYIYNFYLISDTVLFIINLELPSITSFYKIYKNFYNNIIKKYQKLISGIIINRSKNINSGIETYKVIMELLKKRMKEFNRIYNPSLTGIILNKEQEVKTAIQKRIPAIVLYPYSTLKGSFDLICNNLIK